MIKRCRLLRAPGAAVQAVPSVKKQQPPQSITRITLKAEAAALSSSGTFIWVIAIVSGVLAFSIAILLQWLIYDDWMHNRGPLRIVGSVLASLLTIAFVYRWQVGAHKRKFEMLHRFERIKWMNDRIRNSLQAIECVVYATKPHVTNPVRDAVDAIEGVLQEVLVEAHPSPLDGARNSIGIGGRSCAEL